MLELKLEPETISVLNSKKEERPKWLNPFAIKTYHIIRCSFKLKKLNEICRRFLFLMLEPKIYRVRTVPVFGKKNRFYWFSKIHLQGAILNICIFKPIKDRFVSHKPRGNKQNSGREYNDWINLDKIFNLWLLSGYCYTISYFAAKRSFLPLPKNKSVKRVSIVFPFTIISNLNEYYFFLSFNERWFDFKSD